MRISPSKAHSRRNLIITALMILLILASGIGAYAWTQGNNTQQNTPGSTNKPDSNPTSDPPNKQQEGSSSKEAFVTQEEAENTDQAPTPKGIPSLQVIRYEQRDGTVNTSVQGFNVGQGKCVFTFTAPEARPVIREISASNESCNASIPSVEFSKIGIWNLTVSFIRNNSQITEVKQNVTIN